MKKILVFICLVFFILCSVAQADWIITFNWSQNPATGLTGYEIYNQANMTVPIATALAAATSTTVTLPPADYQFILRAKTDIAYADTTPVILTQTMIPIPTGNFDISIVVNTP